MIWGGRSLWRFVALAALFIARPAHATIDYTVSIAHPERHIFDVTMRVPNARNPLTLQMPAWNALYQIRDFSSHMMQVSARDDENHELPLVKLDKQTWQVTASGMVTISYPIYWDEAGPFASQLNPEHAFLNLAMILLYVPDRRAEDTRLKFDGVPEAWRIAVELDPAAKTDPHRCAWRRRRPREAFRRAQAHRGLSSLAHGRRAVPRVHVPVSRRPEFRRGRHGAFQLHGHLRGHPGAIARLFGA
jgi:hypothetical protein